MQMIQLYQLSTGTPLHGTALQCLGFLYRAHPTFMLDENSTTIMDKIFLSTSVEAKALLLRNICDFLVSQAQFDHTDEKGKLRSRTVESHCCY
jgi:cohesin loading factor subunit SCC2